MKKYFLTAFVALACMVNARQPWEKTGTGNLGRQANEQVGVEYTYQRGDVVFNASWGTAHNNQMLTYERTDINTGWRYENGTFNFTSDYVWTDFAARVDVRNEKQLAPITEFGYYKIVDGQPQATMAMMTTDGVNTNKNTVVFEEGDKIGFYVKTAGEKQTNEVDHYEHKDKGKTYTSDSRTYYYDEKGKKVNHNGTPVYKTEIVTNTYTTTPGAIDGATVFVNNVDTDSRGLEDQYFCLFTPKIDGISHYEYYLEGLISSSEGQGYNDFINDVIEKNPDANITDSDGNPVDSTGGQPLPGLLMSMAIGGTALVSITRKRKNKKA